MDEIQDDRRRKYNSGRLDCDVTEAELEEYRTRAAAVGGDGSVGWYVSPTLQPPITPTPTHIQPNPTSNSFFMQFGCCNFGG